MTGTIIGAQLDNYRIVEKLGEGGMGSVYRAVDVMLERDVALKFLRPDLSREPELVERFRAEAVLLARLNHHFIAPIFGLHRYGEELFIAMEYVPGETLDARLKRLERFSPDAALHITSMVLQALDYAHRLGVVHRDIKPGNVILTPGGTVKVMDFGIARVLGAERRTRAGSIVGTIAYMAPEQIQGIDADQRGDLYSVGILLYEMLTGKVPFQADTDWALMQAQIGHAPPALRGQIEISEALETVTLRSLEKSPDRRYQSATEFQRALEMVARQADTGETGKPATPGERVESPTRLTDAPGVANWEETRLGVPTPLPGPLTAGSGAGSPPLSAAPTRPSERPSPDLTVLAPSSAVPPGGSATPSTPAAVPSGPGTPPPASSIAPPGPPAATGALSSPAAASGARSSAGAPPLAGAPAMPAQPAASVAAPKPKPAKAGVPSTAKKNPTMTLAAGVGILLLLGAGMGWVAWQRSQQTPADVPAEADATSTTSPSPSDAPSQPASPDVTATQPGATGGTGSSTATGTPQHTPPASAPTTPGAAPGASPRGTAPATTAAKGTPATGSQPADKRGAVTQPTPEQLSATPLPVPTPPTTPEIAAPGPAKASPSSPVASGPVFRNIRMVRPSGPEVDVELHFGPTSMGVTNVGGRTMFHALDYGSIASIQYQESRHARVFVRTTRYWLLLRGTAGWELRLRLDRDDVKPITAAMEKHWGHQVQVMAPEQEKE
jgi:serine/threonine-protein kinase